MMKPVNEFALNLPIVGVDPMVNPIVDITAQTMVPQDVDTTKVSHIGVYVESAAVVNFDINSVEALVDLVLNISISDVDNGTSKSYKMVKRLSLDKCKLAYDAESLEPTMVEDLNVGEDFSDIMKTFYASKRVREIAGIFESAGNKTANVTFRFKDGEHWTSKTLPIHNIKDKAHAIHSFNLKYSNTAEFKAKYPNSKITQVDVKD